MVCTAMVATSDVDTVALHTNTTVETVVECGEPAVCSYYLPTKRRRCRFPAHAGSTYCVHHVATNLVGGVVSSGQPSSHARVPCPLDPRHSVFAHRLIGHLRSCNRQKEAVMLHAQPWFVQDLHVPLPAESASNAPERPAADVRSLIECIRAAHASLAALGIVRSTPRPSGGDQSPPFALDAEGQSGGTAVPLPSAQRHATQCTALAERVLQDLPSGSGPAAFVEFGAGNATLTEAVALACAGQAAVAGTAADPAGDPACTLVLVDRIVPRHKSDHKLRGLPGVELVRLRTDICHLDLARVPQLGWGGEKRRCAMAKHLCGDATDLTLRCCTHRASVPPAGDGTASSPADHAVDTLVIATCCHQRCSWHSYVNRAALLGWGLTEHTFPLFTALSSWAVETAGGSQNHGAEAEATEEGCEHAGGRTKHSAVLRALVAEQQVRLDGHERRALGIMAKELLDAGRALFLQASGYDCWVEREFVPRGVTPENRLLRAQLRRMPGPEQLP